MPNQASPFEPLLEEAWSSTLGELHSNQNRKLMRLNAILWGIWLIMMGGLVVRNFSLSELNLGLVMLIVFGGLIILPFLIALILGIFASILSIIPIVSGWDFEIRFVRIFWLLATVAQGLLIISFVLVLLG